MSHDCSCCARATIHHLSVCDDSTYVVVAPSKMRPGMDLSVSVNILHATADVSVTASVVRTSNNSEIVSATKTFREGRTARSAFVCQDFRLT